MRYSKYIVICTALLMLVSCGTKKKVQPSAVSDQPAVPAWHTCLIQGSRATISTNTDRISAGVTMQTVRDSMIVISVMPMLGIEMMRLEATPTELIAINKLQGQYAKTTYAELNRKANPNINWDVLQQISSAELPTGPDKARLLYTFGDETIELVLEYGKRQLDVPVRVTHIPVNRYTQIDITKWL